MARKLRIGVIFGGRSGEHEVSVRSAGAVMQAINHKKYHILPIAITQEGRWLPPANAAQLLPQSGLANQGDVTGESMGAVAILGDPSHQGLVALGGNGSSLRSERLDAVFPLIHGTYGEDGTIQGLLEMADIPYVGCGVLASSCGMDKVAMKQLFVQAGLPICNYRWFIRSKWRQDPASVIRKVVREIGYPCFVKPANLGSSVGVSRAKDNASLTRSINLAAEYDRKIIVEEALDAREIECAILGNDDPQASLPGEYIVSHEDAKFLDYTEKYANTGHVKFVVPAPLSKSLTARIQRMAINAFRSIDGAGLARVDFFLTRDKNKLWVNELNTMPGLTEVSGYPKMWAASGMPFAQVFDRLIDLAFERHRDKSLNKTSL